MRRKNWELKGIFWISPDGVGGKGRPLELPRQHSGGFV